MTQTAYSLQLLHNFSKERTQGQNSTLGVALSSVSDRYSMTCKDRDSDIDSTMGPFRFCCVRICAENMGRGGGKS